MQNKEAEKKFFDSFVTAQAYDVFDARGYERLVSEFKALVKPLKGQNLLDVGCGTGAFAEQLKHLGLSITGIDLSFNSVSMACAASPLYSWALGDAERLPFKNGAFDIVSFSGIFHHLPSLERVFAEGLRVLKPGGRVFAYDPNGRKPRDVVIQESWITFSHQDRLDDKRKTPL